MPKKVVFVSNGHGEDINASAIASALKQLAPEVQIGAMPTVGAGNAYRHVGIEIIGPTKAEIPSGGFSYAHIRWLIADIADGVVGRLLLQAMAVQRYRQDADLVLAMGDEVPIGIAALTRRPFFSFLCSTSAHYEQRLLVSWPRSQILKSVRSFAVKNDLRLAQVAKLSGMSLSSVRKLLGVGNSITTGAHLVPLERLIAAMGLEWELREVSTKKSIGKGRVPVSLDELARASGVKITITPLRRK